jgi:hypothetical protein
MAVRTADREKLRPFPDGSRIRLRRPVSPEESCTRAILARMIKNLLAIYNKLDEPLKKTRLPRFIEILGCEQREEGL